MRRWETCPCVQRHNWRSLLDHSRWLKICDMQWHPEKPQFEFSDLTIPHTHDAISVSQYLAGIFLEFARQSDHLPETKEEELAMLIYNYRAILTARTLPVYIILCLQRCVWPALGIHVCCNEIQLNSNLSASVCLLIWSTLSGMGSESSFWCWAFGSQKTFD